MSPKTVTPQKNDDFFQKAAKSFCWIFIRREKKDKNKKGYNLNELLTMVTAPVLENTTLLCRKKQNTTWERKKQNTQKGKETT